jgi:hypothetical protein
VPKEVMMSSSKQAPRYQCWSKHLRVWTGGHEASVRESASQRWKRHVSLHAMSLATVRRYTASQPDVTRHKG